MLKLDLIAMLVTNRPWDTSTPLKSPPHGKPQRMAHFLKGRFFWKTEFRVLFCGRLKIYLKGLYGGLVKFV